MEMQGSLVKGLFLGPEVAMERAVKYLSEGEDVRKIREELTSKRQKLDSILRALHQFSV